jgi:lysophospholipase L1-like esterase
VFAPLSKDDTIVFFGDSITDTGRGWDDGELGVGFVSLVNRELQSDPTTSGCTVLNRGVSGDTALDLRHRFQRDVLDLNPTVVSILVGVNDTWLNVTYDEGTTPPRYEVELDAMCATLAERGVRLVLMDPFMIEIDNEMRTWRRDLDARIAAVGRLAARYGAIHIPTDSLINAAPGQMTEDGVHPTPAGHRFLADSWLGAV